MTYHQYNILVICQKVFEPADGFHIEVIGRFIQQQNIRIAEQCLRQQYPHLNICGNIFHQLLVHFFFYTQFIQQLCSITFRSIATHFTILMLQFPGLHAISFSEIFFHVNGIFFQHQIPHFFVTHHYGMQHTHFIKTKVILRQHCHTFAGRYGYCSLIGLNFST